MKVVAFLPVKGSSERIENKNVKLLDGKPLFLHTLEKLVACEFIDEVYLDSESDHIFQLAADTGCRPLRRLPALATNRTDGHQLFTNEITQVAADIYIQILCTSPFIEPATIKRGIDILRENDAYDSVVLVKRDKQYLWDGEQPIYDKHHIPNSVTLPDTIIETMGLYIMRHDAAHRLHMRYGDRPYLLDATPMEAIDVNFPEDFALANYIAAGRREKDRQLLNNLRIHLTSSMLSDILDDLGVPGIIQGLKPNIAGAKILGRAKTLKLRALREGESPDGIYRALQSYKTIVPNDVIVIENEADGYAYFGELNANLAIRSGAVGTIIGGMTRDSREVTALGYPVYARGTTCRDVRNRATVESMNQRVEINGIPVSAGDLVFADNDGVVAIPKQIEPTVLEHAMRVLNTEKNILFNIMTGCETDSLVERFGAF